MASAGGSADAKVLMRRRKDTEPKVPSGLAWHATTARFAAAVLLWHETFVTRFAPLDAWLYATAETAQQRVAPTAPEMVLIAVEGCCHGELDNIYASVEQLAAVHGTKIDVLLICGDFQAVRNQADLATMACPVKYRDMRTFYKYYSGEMVAPVLTIFIGGNHEASNHNWELYHGGWVAPNIYFLGYAGVVNVGGVRIAGSSGIFNGRHYQMGHYEKPPFDDDAVRSAYHVRELEVLRLLQF